MFCGSLIYILLSTGQPVENPSNGIYCVTFRPLFRIEQEPNLCSLLGMGVHTVYFALIVRQPCTSINNSCKPLYCTVLYKEMIGQSQATLAADAVGIHTRGMLL